MNQRFTKIVATIGPATESEEMLEQIMLAGMNIARFNTKHANVAWHDKIINRVHDTAQKLKLPIGVLLDLQGPEIRIDTVNQAEITLKKSETVIFSAAKKDGKKDNAAVFVPQQVIDSLSPGNDVLLDDGSCELRVVEKQGSQLTLEALHSCVIKHRKTLNTPGVVLDMPALTDRDREFINGVTPTHISFVGLSFVRHARDIVILRAELDKLHYTAKIIAKIENQAALDNLDEIIDAADAIMVARGDLGVETPFQELAYWQKKIISKARDKAKPVITATQMLKSMVDHPRPTRAEVSDVANAIYDGTDAIMLSEETAIGEFPIKAVETQNLIAQFNEQHTHLAAPVMIMNEVSAGAICQAAMGLINQSNYPVDKIVCFTQTGLTARLLSRLRLKKPILVATSNPATRPQLTLSFGVTPYVIEHAESEVSIKNITTSCKEAGMTKQGESVLFIHGTWWRQPGLTNTLSLVTIE